MVLMTLLYACSDDPDGTRQGVLHVLADDCETPAEGTPHLLYGSYKANALLRLKLSDCTNPLPDTPADAACLQVWRTYEEFYPKETYEIVVLPNTFKEGGAPSARFFAQWGSLFYIDRDTMWLGTIDVSGTTPRWINAADIRVAGLRLSHYQIYDNPSESISSSTFLAHDESPGRFSSCGLDDDCEPISEADADAPERRTRRNSDAGGAMPHGRSDDCEEPEAAHDLGESDNRPQYFSCVEDGESNHADEAPASADINGAASQHDCPEASTGDDEAGAPSTAHQPDETAADAGSATDVPSAPDTTDVGQDQIEDSCEVGTLVIPGSEDRAALVCDSTVQIIPAE